MTSPERSPLARLVLFMVCTAIAGSILAGAHYAAVDLPAQEWALHAPANSDSCDINYEGACSKIYATLCRVVGSDPDWIENCMKVNGCCV